MALGIMIIFLTTSGSISITKPITNSNTLDLDDSLNFHTVLGEFGTYTTCIYCKYAHEALIYLFFNRGDDYPFYYVTHVYDKNIHAYKRVKEELGLTAAPTVFWDGGWRKDIGSPNNATDVANYKKSINKCKNRTVADIDLSVDGYWLGAVNNEPEDNATKIPINQTLKWTNTKMIVNVTITNNEASLYNGHLHVYVCDNQSSMGWYDTADRLYTMAFLDYALNHNINLKGKSTWNSSIHWDGIDHTNGTKKYVYENVTEDNTWVIASIFNRDNNNYTDETAGYRLNEGTDPKTFTVYFGNTTPPPLVIGNTTKMTFTNFTLEWNTTYYWRVDVWNKKGEKTKGKIWSFTTRDNHPPNTPSNPIPSNNSKNVSICGDFSWTGGDPDGDNVIYDIYLSECSGDLILIAINVTTPWYQETQLLEFDTCYKWMIVAWDEFGYKSVSPIWYFRTEKNLPPYPPGDPHPKDGEYLVPINVTLCWKGGDPNLCDIVTHDVFFGTNSPPPKVNSTNKTCYNVTGLELFKEYYWQIIAWDSGGLSSKGPVWTFTTGDNSPPGAPKIEGPGPKIKMLHMPKPKPGTYNFTFCAIDPDGDDVFYFIDWYYGTYEDWFGPYPSGEKVTRNHTYIKKGTFTISAKAKDIWDQEGPWGYLHITIQQSRNSIKLLFLQWLNNFPLLQKLLNYICNIMEFS